MEHLRRGRLLARETRPLSAGARAADVKAHPKATHLRCTLLTGDTALEDVRFSIECGAAIEPVGKHFIVIGAMKAGTTTLFELLSQHPALRGWRCHDSELTKKSITSARYTARDTHRSPTTGAFLSRPACTPGRSTQVPARIASLGAETKLACILREPVDRIESHLAHRMQAGAETPNLEHCIRTSRYAMQLDKFVPHIARENILLLDFEELQRDPNALLARVCEFLGIEPFIGNALIHNTRSVDFRLDAYERAELARLLRPDVERLIGEYGFSPAERWLRKRPSGWFIPPAFLR